MVDKDANLALDFALSLSLSLARFLSLQHRQLSHARKNKRCLSSKTLPAKKTMSKEKEKTQPFSPSLFELSHSNPTRTRSYGEPSLTTAGDAGSRSVRIGRERKSVEFEKKKKANSLSS